MKDWSPVFPCIYNFLLKSSLSIPQIWGVTNWLCMDECLQRTTRNNKAVASWGQGVGRRQQGGDRGLPGGASESCGRWVGMGHSGELSQALAFGLQQSTGAKRDKKPQRGVAKLSFTKSLKFGFALWEDLPWRLADLPGTWSTPTNVFKRVWAEGCFHATLWRTGSLHCSSSGLAQSSSEEPDSCSAPSGSTSSRRSTRWGRSPTECQAPQADPTGGARCPLLTSASIQSPCASWQHFASARFQLHAQHRLFL